ncbi:hypothetical protein K456DRAFT_1939012 [Colletotrichum gloeosporioides 23]|nr:hypothetical protein K456DRAFT_1939012 [Colletotrichum gloeosporioides 23]
MLLTRLFPLMRWAEMTFVIDRQLIKDANNMGLGFLSRQLDDALAKDDKSLNGFRPPRTLRFVVGLVLLVENVVVMLVPAAVQQISLASVLSQAGRLCFLNMLLLSLLVMPENSIMPRLVRQCREQWLWAHAFLGYLVAFQATMHAIAALCPLLTLSGEQPRGRNGTSVILLVLVVVLSAWEQQFQAAISKALRNPALAKRPPESSHSIMAHWMLGTVLAGVMMAHTVSDVPWALLSVIALSFALFVGMSITKRASSSIDPLCVVKTTHGQEGRSGGPRVHVLEVGMEASGTAAGEWWYFKVDGIPVRVARLERRARHDGAGYHVVAVLLMSRDPQGTGSPDVRGPYILPLAAPIATNRPLRIITLDSGVVEAQQYLAWRGDLKRVEGACTSLVWLNENPLVLKTWITNAGFNETSQIRIVCFGESRREIDNVMKAEARPTDAEQELVKGVGSNVIALSHYETIQDVLLEEMLLTDDTYCEHTVTYSQSYAANMEAVMGEHFRSYSMSLIRFDELAEGEEEVVDGQKDGVTESG